jgi:alginate O-acetyltransferase complex protein AlgI
MLFTELAFAFFFAAVFALVWALPGNRARKLCLLAASWAFYAAFDPRFLALLAGSTAANWIIGLRLVAPDGRRRRAWLVLGVAANLGVLAIFKYLAFLLDAGASLASVLGIPAAAPVLAWTLPIGISFFTFQGISYLVDVWRGTLAPARDAFDFALFIALFPHLVAGPIVRASELLPQFAARRRFADVRVRAALLLFLSGFAKKAVIADRVAASVDPVFAQPGSHGVLDHWLAAALYHVQIYCDFSGYTDMAIAVAALLGYALPVNFAFPYLARDVRSFWRRWHMTLTRWFRDYLYVPLGGNRGARAATARNLVLVFLLCGLWHGAAWSFLVWGAVHGCVLVLERGRVGALVARLPRPLALAYVNAVVLLAWIPFRAPDLAHAGAFFAALFGAGGGAPPAGAGVERFWIALLPALAALHGLAYRGVGVRLFARLPDWAFALVIGALAAALLPWVATEYRPFIYFQF